VVPAQASTSGAILLKTQNAGVNGVSGKLKFITGTSSFGNTGLYSLTTGLAKYGNGGNISLAVGTGDSGDGGNVKITAGETTMAKSPQGTDQFGGSIGIVAGHGSGTEAGHGGRMNITGGLGASFSGGSVRFHSGFGTRSSSGNVTVMSANSGELGVSGRMIIRTGTSSAGNTGWINITRSEAAAPLSRIQCVCCASAIT
jgi:hypothetical protein